jgi:hypothetical protein
VDQRNTAVLTIIQQLQDAFNETFDALYDLPEGYLEEGCGHACARGGSARDLLVRNIFHEKQHTGHVWNIRDELRLLQGWGNASLYPLLVDYYISRAQPVSSLFRLTDDQMDAAAGGWLDVSANHRACPRQRTPIHQCIQRRVRTQRSSPHRKSGVTSGRVYSANHAGPLEMSGCSG